MQVVAGGRRSEEVMLIRQVDGVMKGGVLAMIAALRARPSEAFDDVARNKTAPWRLLLRRCIEAALAGSTREEAERLVAAFQQALDLIWRGFGQAPRIRLRLLKAAETPTALRRMA